MILRRDEYFVWLMQRSLQILYVIKHCNLSPSTHKGNKVLCVYHICTNLHRVFWHTLFYRLSFGYLYVDFIAVLHKYDFNIFFFPTRLSPGDLL